MTKDVELWAAGAGTLRRRNGERTRDGRDGGNPSQSREAAVIDRRHPFFLPATATKRTKMSKRWRPHLHFVTDTLTRRGAALV